MKVKCFTFLIFYFAFLVESSRGQIVGGESVDIRNFPYQASIRVNGKLYCGACIISQKHVLTAAHCTEEKVVAPYDNVRIHTGTSSSKSSAGEPHPIAFVTVHPKWISSKKTSFNYDIAVITLADTIRFNSRQKKIKLASTNVVSGTDAIVTGWGRTTPGKGSRLASRLQQLRLTLLDYEDCQAQYSVNKLYKEQLCAFYTKGYGICYGDSGSPLVNDLNELVGVVSWMYEHDCAAGIAEIYSNVYAHRDFIMSVVNR